ncbi:FAD-dependent monooxygenase [Mesorhizobium sp. 1B3]|uniref:FAD-dependent monooxygenase n=1 Tax=Mesorhizobium sp. 1B3 TaxID=3243599 RepID=UPI003D99E6FF
MTRSRRIIVAGAGIAGLTAALAFAAEGFDVEVYERAPRLEETGAGLQLSPNATRILATLGVLDTLLPDAVEPAAVVLRDARTLSEAARVPLDKARERWGAPYLVAHRADLQSALLSHVLGHGRIRLVTDAEVNHIAVELGEVAVSIRRNGLSERARGDLLVAADGVWSSIRALTGGTSTFAGDLAWRTTLQVGSPAGEAFARIAAANLVTAFMHSSAHLIAYPMRGGRSINLVALTRNVALKGIAPAKADPRLLADDLRGTASAIARLPHEAGPWTLWPLHTADAASWTSGGRLALIGDAAHAMTPFAAQGAAMAIEDAAVLAKLVASMPDDLPKALERYEALRRPRVAKVARRGAFNRFTWHASGPIALARNFVLKVLPSERLASDLDWLYGWSVADAAQEPWDPQPHHIS